MFSFYFVTIQANYRNFGIRLYQFNFVNFVKSGPYRKRNMVYKRILKPYKITRVIIVNIHYAYYILLYYIIYLSREQCPDTLVLLLLLLIKCIIIIIIVETSVTTVSVCGIICIYILYII